MFNEIFGKFPRANLILKYYGKRYLVTLTVLLARPLIIFILGFLITIVISTLRQSLLKDNRRGIQEQKSQLCPYEKKHE